MEQLLTTQLNCTSSECTNVSDLISNSSYAYKKPQRIVLIVIYVLFILVGLVSNIFLILVFTRDRRLRSVTNYLFVNLAVSDLLVTLICMPVSVLQASTWVFGELVCKLSNYLQGVAVSSGVFTITALSLNRCMTIQHPTRQKIINRQRVKMVIALIWFLAFAIYVPVLLFRKTGGSCFGSNLKSRKLLFSFEFGPYKFLKNFFGMFYFIVVYAAPGLIVFTTNSYIAYTLCSHKTITEFELSHISSSATIQPETDPNAIQSNQSWKILQTKNSIICKKLRTAKILMGLAIYFILSWLPYSVATLILELSPGVEHHSKFNNHTENKFETGVNNIIPFTLLLGHFNSVLNPLLYFMLSKNFWESGFKLLERCFRTPRVGQQPRVRVTFRPYPNSIQPTGANHRLAKSSLYLPSRLQRRNNVAFLNIPITNGHQGLPTYVYCHSSQYPYFATRRV